MQFMRRHAVQPRALLSLAEAMNTARNYQLKGRDHLLSMPFGRPHALLADEQGTGKTIQAIIAAMEAGCKTGVILGPAIIKEQWKREMIKWGLAAEDEIQTIYGLDAQIDNRPWIIGNYDIVRDKKFEAPDGRILKISSRNRQRLHERKHHVLIMDEAHRLKTPTSAQTRAVLGLRDGIACNAYYKWALSGSIVPNRPAEMFALCSALAPETISPYNSWDGFKIYFCGGAWADGKGASNIEEFRERLQPFMLRRELKDVWAELPETFENTVWLDVPYQEHPEWVGEGFMFEGTIRRCVAEAKIPQVVQYLDTRFDGGAGKIVCFTYHRAVIEGISNGLAKYHPQKIYGGISSKQREVSLAKFIKEPHCRLMLLQIGAGGEGLDGLQHVASECVLSEPEWSPGREDQAIARLRRIGQERPVTLTKLYAKNSYEEKIYWSNQEKREVINVLLQPNGGTFVMSLDSDIKAIREGIETLVKIAQGGQQNFAPPAGAATGNGAPAAPVQTPPAAPSAPPAPLATPAATTPQPPAPPAPPSPPAPVADDAKEKFNQEVIGTLGKLGDEKGQAKMMELCKAFHVERLGLLPAEHRENFLAHCHHAVSTPVA